ncbi:glycosyltransferase [Candidatus Woesearchaeota archaeon]|nr:glycosyltransferase [Candidatus Woesearchaeota archaeon]
MTSWPADLVVIDKGDSILPGTIAKISKANIKTANWDCDEPFGEILPFNRIQNISEYDAFFSFDEKYVPRLKEINPHSYHLPAGADPQGVYKEVIPLERRPYPADLCFVGTAYANRINLLLPYAARSLRLAGPKWDQAPSALAQKSLPHVPVTEMVKLFNDAKIVLNPYGPSKSFICPNPRTFEIPASRSFQLTDMFCDAEKYFRIGKEIVLYHDENEFKELVDYYLDRDDERNKIAQAGYERVLKEHTLRHRLQLLLSRMNLG